MPFIPDEPVRKSSFIPDVEPPKNYALSDVPAAALKNLPSSIVDTAKDIWGLGKTAVQLAEETFMPGVFGTQKTEQLIKAAPQIGEGLLSAAYTILPYAPTYDPVTGNVGITSPALNQVSKIPEYYEGAKRYVAEKPAQALFDASLLLSGGGKGVQKLGKYIKGIGEISKETEAERLMGGIAKKQLGEVPSAKTLETWIEKTGQGMTKTGEIIDPSRILYEGVRYLGAKPVGWILSNVLGKTTTVGSGAIKEAFKGGTTQGLRGKITIEDFLQDAETVAKELDKENFASYTSKLEKIKADPNTQTNIWKGFTKDLRELFKKDEFSVKPITDESGKIIDVDMASGTIVKDANVVKKAVMDVINHEDMSVTGLDVLKKRLSAYISQIEPSMYGKASPADAFLNSMKSSLDNGLKANVKGYKELMAESREYLSEIKEIRKELSLAGGNKKASGTAIRKLETIFRDVNKYRADRLDKLDELTGANLKKKLAGIVLHEPLPRTLLGGIGGLFGTGMISAVTHNPYFLSLALASSPRLVGEIANLLGKGARGIKTIEQTTRWPRRVAGGGVVNDPFNIRGGAQ